MSPNADYRIRRFRPEDKEPLLDILGLVWGDRFALRNETIWNWKYEENPHNPPGGHNSMVLEHKDRPVGFLGLMSADVKIGNQIRPMAWGSELAVHPDHLGQGYLFFKYIGESAEKLIAGTASIRDLANLPVAFGAFDVTRMISHKLVLNPRKFLKAKLDNDLLAGAAGLGVKGLTSLTRATRRGRVDKSVKVQKVNRCGPEFDEFWLRVSPQYDLIPVRNSAFLNWRFFDCPNRDYTVLAAGSQDRVKGYAVVRSEITRNLCRGYLVDILAPINDRALFNSLFRAVEFHLQDAGADLITCTTSRCHDHLRGLLHCNGYVFRSARAWVTAHSGRLPENTVHNPEFMNSRKLCLTRADTDLDYNY